MHVSVVLVSPARAENIGAAARAMKTMGFSDLRIVNSDVWQQPAVRWVAHGAGDVIDNVKIFSTLTQALAGIDFTVATTARRRARFHYCVEPAELAPLLQEKSRWMASAALIFGGEASGLSNEELALADMVSAIPMASGYPSLNLAQAVMVYCHQLASLMQHPVRMATSGGENQLQALRLRLDALLEKLGVANDVKLAGWLQQRIGRLEQRDTAMLHRLLHDIEKNITD